MWKINSVSHRECMRISALPPLCCYALFLFLVYFGNWNMCQLIRIKAIVIHTAGNVNYEILPFQKEMDLTNIQSIWTELDTEVVALSDILKTPQQLFLAKSLWKPIQAFHVCPVREAKTSSKQRAPQRFLFPSHTPTVFGKKTVFGSLW